MSDVLKVGKALAGLSQEEANLAVAFSKELRAKEAGGVAGEQKKEKHRRIRKALKRGLPPGEQTGTPAEE